MNGHIVDVDNLVVGFPTHLHGPAFWEALGRTIGTYGFLEETLSRAIFALTGTREYDERTIVDAVANWQKVLEKSLYDPLGALINSYEKALREHQSLETETFKGLVSDLRDSASIRNVLCHGSWQKPDVDGKSLPKFINRKLERFETPIDVAFLKQTQAAVAELVCHVVNSVTHLGYQFPGSGGPGEVVWTTSPKTS